MTVATLTAKPTRPQRLSKRTACPRCGTGQLIKDGDGFFCLQCGAVKASLTRAERREYQRRYNQEHAAERRESQRRYNQEHAAELRESQRRYNQEHRAKRKEVG